MTYVDFHCPKTERVLNIIRKLLSISSWYFRRTYVLESCIFTVTVMIGQFRAIAFEIECGNDVMVDIIIEYDQDNDVIDELCGLLAIECDYEFRHFRPPGYPQPRKHHAKKRQGR